MTTNALLLNATYEPIHVVSTKDAIKLILADKVEVVETSETPFRSAHLTLQIPKVIRLTYYVRVPFRTRLPLTRRNLFNRDHSTCVYCGKVGTTIDHVIPRARGGKHEWENTVVACRPCNGKKKDHTLAELGWTLSFKPWAPKGTSWLLVGAHTPDPTWIPYLGAPVTATAA